MRLPHIFLSEGMARAICWTLIHSLWQGILIAALAGIIIYCTRKLPAALRYNLLAVDLLLFLQLAGITFTYELHRQDPGQDVALSLSAVAEQVNARVGAVAVIDPAGHAGPLKWINDLPDTHALLITGIWLACLSIQLLRVSGGLYQAGRLRRSGTMPSGRYWGERLRVLARQLGIRRPVSLLESRNVRTPSAMGWWKPSILIPLGLLANLPPDQVETILLHELAHIRRNDYAANLVLHLTEAIFFFNPGLRWVATLLRREREACCDDVVLAGTPDRNSYLGALVTFTQWVIDEKSAGARPYTLQLGGGKTDLLWRVRRMINQENKKLQPSEKLILSFGLMALLSIGLVGMHPATVHAVPGVKPLPVAAPFYDTIPAPKAASGQKPITIEQLSVKSESNDGRLKYHAKATDKDGNHYEVRRQNDQVTEFRLNGQLIPKEEYDRYSAIFDSIETARKSIPKPLPPVPAGPPTVSTPTTPPTSSDAPSALWMRLNLDSAAAASRTSEHAPTPEDPMVYNTFKNPYAKQMLLDLIKDGLVADLNHISFVLTTDEMTVNGVLQPNNIYQVYRAKYITHPGDHMIYSQYYTPHGSGTHCECVHNPDIPAPQN